MNEGVHRKMEDAPMIATRTLPRIRTESTLIVMLLHRIRIACTKMHLEKAS